jgi:SSS family solute:Na+ symporter
MAIIILVVYFAFLMALALIVSRRATKREGATAEEYFLASRKMPWWTIFFTMAASWTGISLLITFDRGYSDGLSSVWIMGGPTVVATFILIFYAMRIRRLGSISQPQLFEWRYSKAVRLILAILVAWYMVTWAASELVGIGDSFKAFFGLGWVPGLLIGTAIVLVYTMVGGYRAVIITDIIQYIFLAVVTVVFSLVALGKVGGWTGLSQAAMAANQPDRLRLFHNIGPNLAYIFSFTVAWIIEADIWQRFASAKSARAARTGAIVATVVHVPVYLLATLGGMAAVILVPGLETGVFPSLVKSMVGPVIAAIAFTGVIATVMSSADTSINTGALTLTEDIYHQHINKKATQKTIVVAGWVTTAIVTVLSLVIAWAGKDMLYVLWLAADILAAGAFIPVMVGLFWKRATNLGAIISMIGGTLFALIQFLHGLGAFPFPIIPKTFPLGEWPYYIIWGLVISLILFLIGTLASKPDAEKTKKFFDELVNKPAD